MDAYIARQPIFDEKKALFAYELLFRDGLTNYMPKVDGDAATTKLLSSSFYTIGIERITGSKRAFINFTQNLLLSGVPHMFPRKNTVVEVLEDVSPDTDVVEACKKLCDAGYLLALDDFVFKPEMGPLMELADIIKIDFRLTPINDIKDSIKRIQDYDVQLLAEKVETIEEFNTAKRIGFKYFQGYFFSKPEIIKGKEITSTSLSLMNLMAEVNKPEQNFKEVEVIISRDVAMSYKLLSYINSVFFKRGDEVKTIGQALFRLGENEIKRFVSLMALSKVAANKPSELIMSSCIRARFCEKLGKLSRCVTSADALFTVGLFSNIDAILDQPMNEIMKRLPLDSSIKDALIKREGPLVIYLELTEAYERGDWPKVTELSKTTCVEENKIPEAYVEACHWANELVK